MPKLPMTSMNIVAPTPRCEVDSRQSSGKYDMKKYAIQSKTVRNRNSHFRRSLKIDLSPVKRPSEKEYIFLNMGLEESPALSRKNITTAITASRITLTVIMVADPRDEEIFSSAGIITFSERKLPVAVVPATSVAPSITRTVSMS